MARIAGVSTRDAGLKVRLAYYFTRRQIARLAGRETERMIEPVQVYAHLPGVLSAYGRLEQATAKLDRLEDRFKALAELKAATLTNCEYCIDLGSQIARRWGLSDGHSCWRFPATGRATCSTTPRSSCSTTRWG